MKKRIRGRCVILSNQTFMGPLERDKKGVMRVVLPARLGTEKDVNNLESLFEQLHFDVVKHREKKAQVCLMHQVFVTTSSSPRNSGKFDFLSCNYLL